MKVKSRVGKIFLKESRENMKKLISFIIVSRSYSKLLKRKKKRLRRSVFEKIQVKTF